MDTTIVTNDVLKLMSDWGTLGWLAGTIMLINILINITKMPAINTYLTNNKLKWLKPFVAAILGGLLGVFSSYQQGLPLPQAIVTGIMIGISSTGFQEFMGASLSVVKKSRRS